MEFNYFEESNIKNEQLPKEWQSQDALNNLATFLQQNWEQRSVFYNDGYVTSKQQFIGFVGQKGIRTQNYIGTIVFKGQQLNIFPKIFRESANDDNTDGLNIQHLMKNLVKWLDYCSKIEYPYISIKSELENYNNLRDLFIALYIRYVKNALDRGIFYRYEDITEDCSAVKGKINIKDYFLKKYPNGQLDKFSCTYSNFEFDNALNRIIKCTCKLILKEDVSKINKKILRHILTKLNEVADINCNPHDCDKVKLSKLHKHYSIILSMSKMFLLNKTSSYSMDKTESFCFLFPTELLFEGFIGGFMQSILQDEAKVRLQASDMYLFSNVVRAGKSLGKAMKMKHDILVEHNMRGMFILDTKYKMIDRFNDNDDIIGTLRSDVASSDIYQVLSYARTRHLKDVYLLYPMFRYEDLELEPVWGVNDTVDGKDPVNVHFVRLPFVFEEDATKTLENLRKTIVRIFD